MKIQQAAVRIQQTIERALFGATAEEAVAMRLKLIDQRVEQALEQRVARLIDALEQDSDQDSDSAPDDTDLTADNQSA